MKWEIWGIKDSGEKVFLATKYRVEAAEERQHQEQERGFFEKVLVRAVEE